jgi:hypothetical protein
MGELSSQRKGIEAQALLGPITGREAGVDLEKGPEKRRDEMGRGH